MFGAPFTLPLHTGLLLARLPRCAAALVLLDPTFLVSRYHRPVPGRPTDAVLWPLVLYVRCAPRTPIVIPTDCLLRFSFRPGASLNCFLNLSDPMVSHSFFLKRYCFRYAS